MISFVTDTDHTSGPRGAAIVVVEYGDFQCPICQSVEPAVKHLRALHSTDMTFVFRHFPLEEVHPQALMAAEAAEAAGAQGRFWEMHDLLLAPGRKLTRSHLDDYARQIGLDMPRFAADLDDEIYRQRVREHQDSGRRGHLRATPGFFVNGATQDVSGGMQALFDAVARLAAKAR
jgi:protein-disulfide isomerase